MVEPGFTAVTVPSLETVAILVSPIFQEIVLSLALAGNTFAITFLVWVGIRVILVVSNIISVTGTFTVTSTESETLPTVRVIVAVPFSTAVTFPF